MIPPKLQHQLLNEVFVFGQGATTAAGPTPKGYLYALIEMGAQSQEKRSQLNEQLQGWLYPLLTEPGYEPLTRLGAMLVAAPQASFESQQQLLQRLEGENSDVVATWISSILPPEEMAGHLRQAAFAHDAQGQLYLLRYYDPLITPVLYGNAAEDWQRWFFGPIISWWFAQPSASDVEWLQLRGYQTPSGANTPAPRLLLTQALLQALESDPLPYRLLPLLEALNPPVFTQNCRGMRLAQVQALFAQARKQGLADPDSQCDYVRIRLQYPALAQAGNARWQQAMAQARKGQGPLARLLGL